MLKSITLSSYQTTIDHYDHDRIGALVAGMLISSHKLDRDTKWLHQGDWSYFTMADVFHWFEQSDDITNDTISLFGDIDNKNQQTVITITPILDDTGDWSGDIQVTKDRWYHSKQD